MSSGNKIKIFVLLVGDIIALYAALFAALVLRYGTHFYRPFLDAHLVPFTIIFIPWILIFYIAGLYDLRRLRNNIEFAKTLATSIAINAFVAIFLFYLVPAFGIAPKTNLIIFIVVFTIVEFAWRNGFNKTVSFGEIPNKIVLVGMSITAEEITQSVGEHPQLGYQIVRRMFERDATTSSIALDRAVTESGANIVIVPGHLKQENGFALALYKLFGKGVLIIDLENFYERIMRKVPLADLNETWFLENIEASARFYDPLKRTGEFVAALVIGIVLLPFEFLIAVIVKLTSRGPMIYSQTRVGKNEKKFMLYKFRTMRADAERAGAQWASKNDARVTPFGKFLRATHLDELPQLANIIRGDISFVGPRPERPEFVERLKEQVPYYEVRLLVVPGLTGWAQINHRADLTVDDVKEKLRYDVYYLKNRSIFLDCAIVLKTIKSIFVNPE
jgi:exopolysaccharide biosynthesis polyprenyl glycosylphosphotransferase